MAMTPYMTPGHSSQTPRYNQLTPTQHGQFLRPGAPVSRPPPQQQSYRQSPFTGQSPRAVQQSSREPGRRMQSQEDDDWERASNAWGSSRMKENTPRGDSMGRTTPRGG